MKRTKQSSGNLPSVDRLSALPDGILCHILSFLPTKASLSTSILARRWRFLWAHVPDLDFDCQNHHSETSFSSIITRVMFLHKVQKINTFCLRLCLPHADGCSLYELETLIVVVISRNVHILHICLNSLLTLPSCLFTCKTLVLLRLERCVINSFTGAAVFLPCLKTLHLTDVQYDVGENLAKLFTGCPVLDEFFMKRLEEDGLVGCKIFSPTIKKIVLEFPYPSENNNSEHKVELNTPALIDLRLTGFVSMQYVSSQKLTSLTQVDVTFNYDMYDGEGSKYFQSMDQLLRKVTNLFRKLDNLKKLELNGSWIFLANFLAFADNLEVLIIHEVFVVYLNQWMEPEKVPTCLSSHLRSVIIDDFRYDPKEFKMVKYILRNARVLKRIEISSRLRKKSVEEKFEALQRISLFHRASETCELAFY